MRLDKKITELLQLLDPSFRQYVREDGTSIVELKRALYGLIQSAKLWYDELSSTLLAGGFKKNPYEDCVFNKDHNGHQLSIYLHVDDLFVTCKDELGITYVENLLKKKYSEITCYRGNRVEYLGMIFHFTGDKVEISQAKFVEDFLREAEVTATAPSPAAPELFAIDPTSPKLDLKRAKKFHSWVASLLYLAKRTRPDILLPVGFLTTRVLCSSEEDQKKLERVIRYLNGTRDLSLHLACGTAILVALYADAAFAVHPEAKSHTGSLLTMGLGAFHARSGKQGLVTKSSTESELVAMSDSLAQAMWARLFLIGQGYDVPPVEVHQDNMSTISLAEKGKSTSDRTRHINIRYFWVTDCMDRGDVKVGHTRTLKQYADCLTKPLQGKHFLDQRKFILGV